MINSKTEKELLSLPIEDEDNFITKLLTLKESGELKCSFEDISELVYTKFRVPRSSTWYRRHKDEFLSDISDNSVFDNKLLELKKERVKLSDERTQNNAYIRRLAREDTIKEIALLVAERMNDKKLLEVPEIIDTPSKRDAILTISDWHYGVEVENALNKFNPEICKERVAKLTAKTLQHCRAYGITHLNLLNLGDMIAGRIHLQLRVESRFDTITQIMEVSEILAEMITNLSKELVVDYYSCTDNHSRLEPNKKESLELETLARVTDWYLKTRLSNNSNVRFNSNTFGPDIITLTCKGHNIVAVHGDDDSPTTAATALARLTRDTYDMVLISHRHHFGADELNETVVIQNSSLMGTDSHAFKYRLSALPSQNLVIVSEDNVTEAVHRIVLD